MNNKILFGFFIVTFIAMNIVFTIQPGENDISLSQMLKLSQANAEWPFDPDECSTYCSNIQAVEIDECITRYISDYDCDMLLGGGCYHGKVDLWVNRCTYVEVENDYRTYLSCGS